MRRWLFLAFWLVAHAHVAQATVDADGAGTFLGASSTSFTGTWYMGGIQTNATQTTGSVFWSTGQAFTSCTGTVSVHTAPGAGGSWAFSLLNAAPSTTSSCPTAIGGASSTALGNISGTDTSLTFTASPTIAANDCLQLKATASGTPTGTGGQSFSAVCTDGTGGHSIWSRATTVSATSTTHLGGGVTTNALWINEAAYQRCSGNVILATAPGNTKSWDVEVEYSTTALGATQDCSDLTYTATSPLCSISGASELGCSFSAASVSATAGGCIGIQLVANGGPTGTGGEVWSLDCSTDATTPYYGGGGVFWNNVFAANANDVYAGLAASTTVTNEENHWHVGGQPLVVCSGGVTLLAASAGNNGLQWPVQLRYTTSGISASQNCGGASYTTTSTLCTVTGSSTTHASCSFSNAAIAAAANGCLDLKLVGSGGTPTGNISAGLECLAPSPTPTATPTITPTATNTPTPTPTIPPTCRPNECDPCTYQPQYGGAACVGSGDPCRAPLTGYVCDPVLGCVVPTPAAGCCQYEDAPPTPTPRAWDCMVPISGVCPHRTEAPTPDPAPCVDCLCGPGQ